MKKKQKPFYYLEFGSPDLMFGSFCERYSSKAKALKALEGYIYKYVHPWGHVYKVIEVVAEVKQEVRYPKSRKNEKIS